MTYFGFLARFLLIPLGIMALLLWRDRGRDVGLPVHLRNFPGWAVILLHVAVAVIYTTPWDNYLVATGVWWYDPALVTGVTLGWVPIEEYTFFVLQTLLTGMWLLWLAPRLAHFNETYPGIDLHLRCHNNLVDFETENIDLAICYSEGHHPDLHTTLLMPDNDTYETMALTPEVDCTLWGVVIHIIRTVG